MATFSIKQLTLLAAISASLSTVALFTLSKDSSPKLVQLSQPSKTQTRPQSEAPQSAAEPKESPTGSPQRESGERPILIAGVNPLDVEQSLLRLARRLQLDEAQQQGIRQIFEGVTPENAKPEELRQQLFKLLTNEQQELLTQMEQRMAQRGGMGEKSSRTGEPKGEAQ